MQIAACTFHLQALHADEPFDVDLATGEIRLEVPPEIINFIVERGPVMSTITFVIGRDGDEQQRFTVRTTKEMLLDAANWL